MSLSAWQATHADEPGTIWGATRLAARAVGYGSSSCSSLEVLLICPRVVVRVEAWDVVMEGGNRAEDGG